MSRSGIEKVCETANKVRETYYSDTYRAKFKLGGNLGVWDVTHISIPFPPEKERELIEYFNISEPDLAEYYVNFGKHLDNDLMILKSLHESDNEQLASNFAKILFVDKDSCEGRENIYVVTEPMYPITDSEFIKNGTTTTLLDLLQISARFTQTLKLCQELGLRLGSVDLDTTYLVNKDERQMLVIGSLLHAAEYDKPLPTIPAHAHECVKDGTESPTFKSDLHSVFSLMWTVLSGNHYTTKPDFETYPLYATEEMRGYLEKGIKAVGENVLKEMHSDTYGFIKKIKRGEMANITIEMAPPIARSEPPGDPEGEVTPETEAEARSGTYAEQEVEQKPDLESGAPDSDTDAKSEPDTGPAPCPDSETSEGGEKEYFDSACGWVPKSYVKENDDPYIESSSTLIVEETTETVEIDEDSVTSDQKPKTSGKTTASSRKKKGKRNPNKTTDRLIIGLIATVFLLGAIITVLCFKYVDFSALIGKPADSSITSPTDICETFAPEDNVGESLDAVKDFYVSPSGEMSLEVGEMLSLTASDDCVWTSSDPTIAIAYEGSVIGVASGVCTLSAEQISSGTVIEVQVTVLDS